MGKARTYPQTDLDIETRASKLERASCDVERRNLPSSGIVRSAQSRVCLQGPVKSPPSSTGPLRSVRVSQRTLPLPAPTPPLPAPTAPRKKLTVVLSVLEIVLLSSVSVPALMEATAP